MSAFIGERLEKIRLEEVKILTVLVRKLLVWPQRKNARKLNHACVVTSAALLLGKNFSNDQKVEFSLWLMNF